MLENLKKDPEIDIQEFTEISEVKEADIIHYPWFDFFFHTLPINKKFKTVVTIHDVIPLMFPEHYPVGLKGKYFFLLQKLALKNCKRIITDSDISKADISKYLKQEEKKISVVHLAANENFKIQTDTKLIHIKRKYHLPERFILYVGDGNWVKNIPFLIEGFKELSKINDFSDVALVLINGVFLKNLENIDHPELKDLKKVNELIKYNNLEDKVIKPGDLDLDELISFYNLATVYVQPSLYEGFGLPILEAFRCGVPVLSSNRGSLMEVGGNAATYFDPTKMDQFVSLLMEVLENKSLRDKLSKLGFQQAEKFSWEKVIDETKKVYSEVING
ncbi:MAG: glycosyltransferase family 1 protein [Candidatus Daviesbacteria bacterium]|nr:glycosyltransferase family 1 protein [Candidatus Daviesbacteria bacterium]